MRGISAAEYVIERAKGQGTPITNLKLQKTLYYLQGYSYRKLSRPTIEDDFYNWQYGPVIPAVYFEYSDSGSDCLERHNWIPFPELDAKEERVYDRVIDKCLTINASDLVSMSHLEDPWAKTQLRERITNESIETYFAQHDPLNLF